MTMTLQGMNGNNVTIVYNLDGTDTKRTMTDARRQPSRKPSCTPSGTPPRSS